MNFLDKFSNNPQISYFMKIRPVGAEFLHADWHTWRSEIIPFHNIANAPKIVSETETVVDSEDWNSVVYFKFHA